MGKGRFFNTVRYTLTGVLRRPWPQLNGFRLGVLVGTRVTLLRGED